jgi:hypothetical protein
MQNAASSRKKGISISAVLRKGYVAKKDAIFIAGANSRGISFNRVQKTQ